jgi:hypothetical protein
MINHLIVNNLLSDSQYGFRLGRSCAIQLLEILDEWSILLDSSNPVDSIYRNCTVAAILVGESDCRTQFWKRTIQ